MRTSCAIMGSGNIGTDLMYKVLRSDELELRALIGIDPDSEGLARAATMDIPTSCDGIEWVVDNADAIDIIFEATSAAIHRNHAPVYKRLGLTAIDLTPAKVGPPVVPSVNLNDHLGAPNVNMVTCGGQATTPISAAVRRAADVPYAEIASTVAPNPAGPGTRANIDELTTTTSASLEEVDGAAIGKAITILNPADPPILRRLEGWHRCYREMSWRMKPFDRASTDVNRDLRYVGEAHVQFVRVLMCLSGVSPLGASSHATVFAVCYHLQVPEPATTEEAVLR